MCEKCDEQRKQDLQKAKDDIAVLLRGEIPEECGLDADADEADRMRSIIVRAGFILAIAEDVPMSIAIGAVAGTCMREEAEIAMAMLVNDATLRFGMGDN